MDAASHQRILGYFIEEAKEHLETLEKGILALSSVIDDNETINEMFRAAHSVKGGAAMLGYTSIQKTAHRLEDAFKILRDDKVDVDQRLESLFLEGYDVLEDLISRLESPEGLVNETGEAVYQQTEHNFLELLNYLEQLRSGVGSTLSGKPGKSTFVSKEADSSNTSSFVDLVKKQLKEMLVVFKQEANTENRQKLQVLCAGLAKLAPNEEKWQDLVITAQQAIANSQHSFPVLATVIIQDIKRSSDYIEMQKGEQISISQSLEKLAHLKSPQILVTVEPKAAANILIKAFNQQQLTQLVKLLKAAS